MIRIGSLYPPATEIAFALGAGEQIVGVSHACDHPPEAKEKKAVTHARFNVDGLSCREIYNQKVETSQRFGSLFRLSETALWGLRANVLITQGPADFSMVSLQGIRAIAEGLNPRPEVLALYPRHLDDVLEDHIRIGFAIERMDEGRELASSLRQRVEHVAGTVRAPRRLRVAFIQWLDPCFSGGYWIPQLIEIAGGLDVLNIAGVSPSPVEYLELRRQNPDVIIVACDELSIDHTISQMSVLTRKAGWRALLAVRTARVFIGDGPCFTRTGPRVVTALEAMAWAMYPELFPKPSADVLQRFTS